MNNFATIRDRSIVIVGVIWFVAVLAIDLGDNGSKTSYVSSFFVGFFVREALARLNETNP